jgi:metal-dependent amidase/aminoacylase/carboxypeptidase family protein
MGTVRTFTMPIKRMVQQRLQEIAHGIASSHGPKCGISVKFLEGYPACVNDHSCATAVLDAGKSLLGSRLVGPPTPNMAGEDFCFFLHRKPGAFFFVGSNPDAAFAMDPSMPVEEEEYIHGTKKTVAHHTPEFDIHEGALWCGAAMWVKLAADILK